MYTVYVQLLFTAIQVSISSIWITNGIFFMIAWHCNSLAKLCSQSPGWTASVKKKKNKISVRDYFLNEKYILIALQLTIWLAEQVTLILPNMSPLPSRGMDNHEISTAQLLVYDEIPDMTNTSGLRNNNNFHLL